MAKIGDYKYCLEITQHILKFNLSNEQQDELNIRKGIAYSNVGEMEKGKEILEKYLESGNKIFFNEVSLELSRIELKLNNYSKTEEYCNILLNDPKSGDYFKGQASNILGLVEIYRNNSPQDALKYFEQTRNFYQKANNMIQIAAIEVNIGNIHSMLMNDDEAKNHWNKALQINQTIGNVEQEANILMNTGIFYFRKHEYEAAVENYKRARNIFAGIGNKFGNGLALSNMGEAHMQICEYSAAIESLETAHEIFRKVSVKDELIEVLFHRAKCYYHLNSENHLENIIAQIDALSKSHSNERIEKILQFADLLSKVLSKTEVDIPALKQILEYFIHQDDAVNIIETLHIVTVYSVDAGHCDEALNIIENPDYEEYFQSNITAAWKNYFYSLIAEKFPKEVKENEIFYLNQALSLIEEESITELTIIIIVKICKYYIERGNTKKAESYCEYFDSLNKLVAENIPSKELKNNYAQKKYIIDGITAYKSVKSN